MDSYTVAFTKALKASLEAAGNIRKTAEERPLTPEMANIREDAALIIAKLGVLLSLVEPPDGYVLAEDNGLESRAKKVLNSLNPLK